MGGIETFDDEDDGDGDDDVDVEQKLLSFVNKFNFFASPRFAMHVI